MTDREKLKAILVETAGHRGAMAFQPVYVLCLDLIARFSDCLTLDGTVEALDDVIHWANILKAEIAKAKEAP